MEFEYFILEKKKEYLYFCKEKLDFNEYFDSILSFLGKKGWELVSSHSKTEGLFFINNGDGEGQINSSKEKYIFKKNKSTNKKIEIETSKEFILNDIYEREIEYKNKDKKYEEILLKFLKNEKEFLIKFFSQFKSIEIGENYCIYEIIDNKAGLINKIFKKHKNITIKRKIEILRIKNIYKINIYQKKNKNFSIIMSLNISFEEICENPNVFKEIYILSQKMDMKND